jgi:hypothetical protein
VLPVSVPNAIKKAWPEMRSATLFCTSTPLLLTSATARLKVSCTTLLTM